MCSAGRCHYPRSVYVFPSSKRSEAWSKLPHSPQLTHGGVRTHCQVILFWWVMLSKQVSSDGNSNHVWEPSVSHEVLKILFLTSISQSYYSGSLKTENDTSQQTGVLFHWSGFIEWQRISLSASNCVEITLRLRWDPAWCCHMLEGLQGSFPTLRSKHMCPESRQDSLHFHLSHLLILWGFNMKLFHYVLNASLRNRVCVAGTFQSTFLLLCDLLS